MNVSPTAVSINLFDRVDWNHEIDDHVGLDLSAPDGALTASRRSYDPLWDGPYAQPARPGDFSTTLPSDGPPALAAATRALRDALAGLDLVHAAPFDGTRNGKQYATVHLSFPSRPAGLDHLRPFQDADGRWTVGLNTSTDDLLVDPSLTPIVDAARAVTAAAHDANG